MIRAMVRGSALWPAALQLLAVGACAPVVLTPGQDIQAIVVRSPEGTQFRFEPGIYRQQTIYPKHGQKFVGQDGAILNGAMALTTWTGDRGLWMAGGLPGPLPFHGECADGRDLCKHREDLFVDGRLYQRVGSLAELGPGRWYYAARRAYLADDPTGRSVELGVTPLAFGGDAEDVVLEDLVIEKYASDAQEGTIYADRGRGWRIVDVTARWNHGVGLSFGPRTDVKGGSYLHNGQLGLRASGGQGSTVDGVEIAFNNYAGYNPGWEAGGTKFVRTRHLIVRDSCVHHNNGPGLWTDIDNLDVLYERNRVFLNANDGIKHEISYAATIRDNVVVQNGTSGFDIWLWGSQILIQNSSDVEISHNYVEVSDRFGNGIGVIQQNRGAGAYGPSDAINNSVTDNTIVHLGDRGRNGIVTDTDEARFWSDAGNQFDRNRYVVPDRAGEYWLANGRGAAWSSIEDLGFEREGRLTVAQRPPSEPSCALTSLIGANQP